ncbi:MAG: M23 family metallopeptidase [Clostridia bacterium]|nr:M23 family metallopeptidase [Clostridia bacterium]
MQQSSLFWQKLKRLYDRYDRLMEKQGFYVVLAVCVTVIAGSAIYTFHQPEGHVLYSTESSLTATTKHDQTLREAQALISSVGAQSTAVPTQQPYSFTQPVEGTIIRDYSADEPQLFSQAKYWRIHPGIDFKVEYGTPVKACASGRVLNVWQDGEKGLCIRLKHEYGFETVYAGLSDASYVRAGDLVVQGQTLGHAGNGVLAETDAPPHLHFEVWRNESSVDPVKVFLGIVQ